MLNVPDWLNRPWFVDVTQETCQDNIDIKVIKQNLVKNAVVERLVIFLNTNA